MRRQWLINRRLERGYSQVKLARLCGVTSDMISKIERGERMPSGKLALKMARVLGFEMALFFEEKSA